MPSTCMSSRAALVRFLFYMLPHAQGFQGLCRVVIGVQVVIAGFQLPAKYQLTRWKEMLICLLPVMTMMWICTTGCILITIPKLTLVTTKRPQRG